MHTKNWNGLRGIWGIHDTLLTATSFWVADCNRAVPWQSLPGQNVLPGQIGYPGKSCYRLYSGNSTREGFTRELCSPGQPCHGTVVPRYHGTMVPWYYGTMVPWYHGNMAPWYHGTMVRTMVPWYYCTMVPWYHGTTVPWYHGTMVITMLPWYHGTVPWYHGTMVPWSHSPMVPCLLPGQSAYPADTRPIFSTREICLPRSRVFYPGPIAIRRPEI